MYHNLSTGRIIVDENKSNLSCVNSRLEIIFQIYAKLGMEACVSKYEHITLLYKSMQRRTVHGVRAHLSYFYTATAIVPAYDSSP